MRVDPASFRAIDEALTKQVPFAEARALTSSAQVAVAGLRQHIGTEFKVRNRTLLKRWRVAERAQKRDWPKLRVVVGTPDALWAKHEKGGVQRPKGRTFTIPTRIVVSRRKASGALPANLKPRQLIAKGRAFKDPEQIRSAAKRGVLAGKVLFLRRRKIELKPVLQARAVLAKEANAEFRRVFPRFLDEAVSSAKKRR